VQLVDEYEETRCHVQLVDEYEETRWHVQLVDEYRDMLQANVEVMQSSILKNGFEPVQHKHTQILCLSNQLGFVPHTRCLNTTCSINQALPCSAVFQCCCSKQDLMRCQ